MILTAGILPGARHGRNPPFRHGAVDRPQGDPRATLGLPCLPVDEAGTVTRALAWYKQGLDFADSLHLASAAPAESFAPFDAGLIRRARRLGSTIPVHEP